MKKFLATTLVLALFAASFSFAACGGGETSDMSPREDAEVVVFHTNDTHGYLQSDGRSIIGIDMLASLHKSTKNSILVDAGDATQGLPLASLTQGADVIDIMNTAGYDLMAMGNHEFDFGADVALANAALAQFPVLSANALKDGHPLTEGVGESGNGGNAVIEVEGYKIGFFGITTADTGHSVNPELLGGVTFADEIQTAKTQIDALKEQDVDAIIAICHLGDGDASCTSTQFASAMTGEYAGAIDVIIDGHSHTVENSVTNGTLIVQTGTGMSAVGQLTLTLNDGGLVSAEEKLLTYADFSSVTPDEATAAKLDEISSEQAELLAQTVANSDFTLRAGYAQAGTQGAIAIARVVETNLGDFVADAFLREAQAYADAEGLNLPVIAAENAGGIRGSLPCGEVTMGDLVTAFPYSNTLYLKVVTPAILYEVMELSGSYIDGIDSETGMLLQGANSGGFLQIAGFTVVYNADASAGGEHVLSITLDGQDVALDRNDDSTRILMAGNNYILSGGSGYDILGSIEKTAELGGELEAVLGYVEYCEDNGGFGDYARARGRIVMHSEQYTPADYQAKILILSGDGAPAAGQTVNYIVDGGAAQIAVADEEGYITIAVADGGHNVRLEGGSVEAYVDNYLGIGLTEDIYRGFPRLQL